MKFELDLSNYATKADLKNVTGVHTSKLTKTVDLASLKSDLDKLDIDKLKNVSTNLSNLKSILGKLDVDILVPAPIDLSKLIDVVQNDVVKKDLYNAKIINIVDKISDTTKLATNTTLNAKINDIKNKISNVTNLATTTALIAVKNKIANDSNLVKKTDYNPKISKIQKKITTIHNHDKYNTTQEFNSLT